MLAPRPEFINRQKLCKLLRDPAAKQLLGRFGDFACSDPHEPRCFLGHTLHLMYLSGWRLVDVVEPSMVHSHLAQSAAQWLGVQTEFAWTLAMSNDLGKSLPELADLLDAADYVEARPCSTKL